MHRAAWLRSVAAAARVRPARALDAARAVTEELIVFDNKGGLRVEHVHAAAAVKTCVRGGAARRGRGGGSEGGRGWGASEQRRPERAARSTPPIGTLLFPAPSFNINAKQQTTKRTRCRAPSCRAESARCPSSGLFRSRRCRGLRSLRRRRSCRSRSQRRSSHSERAQSRSPRRRACEPPRARARALRTPSNRCGLRA